MIGNNFLQASTVDTVLCFQNEASNLILVDLQECNHYSRLPPLSLSCHRIPKSFPVQKRELGLGGTAERTDSPFILLHDWIGASQNSSA